MAEFVVPLKPKKSSVSGEVPASGDLLVAEIAVNTADGKLFTKHTDGSVKTITGVGDGEFFDGAARVETPSVTTASLLQNESEDVTITGTGRAGQFLKVESSGPAWVVFYSSRAARTADIGRSSSTNPTQGDGVMLELFFDVAESISITPSALYWNDDVNEGAEIYAKVTNRGTSAAAITIDTTVIPIEGRPIYEAQGSTRQIIPSVTTSNLTPGASENLTMPRTARAGQFISVTTDQPARVVFYSNKAARTADALRTQGTPVASGNGVIMELVTTGAQTLEMTPAVMYHNTEPNAAGELYLRVTNLAANQQTITVDAVVVPIEGRGVYLSELHELLDVDAPAPTDGQSLIYDGTAQKWVADTVASGGGAVSSVNGQTGAVVLSASDVGAITPTTWQLTSNGASDYVFTGPGLDGINDPTIYLMRGQEYRFTNQMNAHPFRIQQVGGGAYSDGITNNSVSNGTLTFVVPMNAPATLEYICTLHPSMKGTIHVLTEDSISLATLKTEVAAATDFSDFQSRIAAL